MYWLYILKHSRKPFIYIGYTANLMRRYQQHQKDKLGWKLVYCEGYASEEDARLREQKLKQYGSSLGHLKKRIARSLERAG